MTKLGGIAHRVGVNSLHLICNKSSFLQDVQVQGKWTADQVPQFVPYLRVKEMRHAATDPLALPSFLIHLSRALIDTHVCRGSRCSPARNIFTYGHLHISVLDTQTDILTN